MASVLVLLAHPLLERSRAHATLLSYAKSVQGVTINDLYERYPDFDIDVAREKSLLLNHDIIVWQHPLYWYSAPPLLKQWQDIVLEHGWAYGRKGEALVGKKVFNALSSGGSMEAYQPNGYNKYAIYDYLRPFERTAELCRMLYWPPFWVHGVHRMDLTQIRQCGEQYKSLLTALVQDIFSDEEIGQHALLNDLIPTTSTSAE